MPAASGWCQTCGRRHTILRTPEAEAEALGLHRTLEMTGCFDFSSPSQNDRYRVDRLTSGKMLGVLTCSDGTVLRAFSGMLGGRPGTLGTWRCPGWVGPVARMTLEDDEASQRFARIVHHVQAAERCPEPERSEHRATHRALSLSLSADLAASVTLRNVRGASVCLPDLLAQQRELAVSSRLSLTLDQQRQARVPPGGIGDCAAPKLLTAAFERGLHPTGLAEIWYEAPVRRDAVRRLRGRAAREHGSFYAACEERCEPIMGFMLCGLDDVGVRLA